MQSVDGFRNASELAEYERILNKQNRKAFLVWRMMLTAVLRVGDCLAITRSAARKAIKTGVLEVSEKKTGKLRQVSVTAELSKTMSEALSLGESGAVFLFEGSGRNRQPGKALSRTAVSNALSGAGDTFNALTDNEYRVNCHSARKTAGLLLRKSGMDTAIISARIFGHSSEQVTRHYLGITDNETTEAFNLLSQVVSDGEPLVGDAHLQVGLKI